MEAKPGFEPGVKALQASALPLGHFATSIKKVGQKRPTRMNSGADNGARTRDPNLGKVVLYQLSHVRASRYNSEAGAWMQEKFFLIWGKVRAALQFLKIRSFQTV